MTLPRGTVKYGVLTIVALVMVALPVWVLVVNSLKPLAEVRELNLGLPETWQAVENYERVLEEGDAPRGFLNSLLITAPTVLLVLIAGSVAGWVFARGRGRTLSGLYYLAIAGILLPPSIVTSVLVLQELGVHGTRLGVILFYSGILLPVAVFFITGFVKTIPVELEEAARMEGYRPVRVFWSVILPLLRPVLSATLIILVLAVWNDFFTPFFLINDESQNTLTLGLFEFISGQLHETRWNLMFADVIVVSLPMLVVFAVAQRRIVSGLMGGAVD